MYLNLCLGKQQPAYQHEIGGGGGDSGHLPLAAPPRPEMNPARLGSTAERARLGKVAPPEGALKCPRCESTNTKFCYFNNYSLSQPRHFCKTCRRYWTRGGALRNVPVGGGCRRNKRSKSGGGGGSSKSSAADRHAGSSTSIVAPSCGDSAAHCGVLPLPQFPFMDYLAAAANLRLNLPGGQPVDALHCQLSGGLEEWRIQQVQEFPHLTAMEQVPAPPSMGLFQFQEEPPVSQLSMMKMEENSQRFTLPEQHLGISGNYHYWGGGVGGEVPGGSVNAGGWAADLSGFNLSSTSNLI
ncbi:unnamed protein product [Spirodela intermedia]|uniref:Dof zinc finger protein n=1 Tax=Spirodela intermedia TaxID=51605 RepID=A0A7I8IUR1_SPIIN|nr:unnamed protein product [Spirodela intermedia]CAA6661754.1 unnamed protein product [Spirodela intermedia]